MARGTNRLVQIDHFFWLDKDDVMHGSDVSPAESNLTTTLLDMFTPPVSPLALDRDLKSEYKSLSRLDKVDFDDFAIVHVAPSVVPTYNPAIRVWIYNVSNPDNRYRPKDEAVDTFEAEDGDDDGFEDEDFLESPECATLPLSIDRLMRFTPSWPVDSSEDVSLTAISPSELEEDLAKKGRKHRGRKKKRRRKKPRLPRHASPHSPSRTNRFLTPLSYTQFFINLDEANKHDGWGRHHKGEKGEIPPPPKWQVEYTTTPPRELARHLLGSGVGVVPSPFPEGATPDGMRAAVEASGGSEERLMEMLKGRWAPYGLPDLTIPRWLGFAKRLIKSKKEWERYVRHMFVSGACLASKVVECELTRIEP
jgi:endopolyphosphatase